MRSAALNPPEHGLAVKSCFDQHLQMCSYEGDDLADLFSDDDDDDDDDDDESCVSHDIHGDGKVDGM